MNNIYMDNAATTRPLEEVAKRVYECMLDIYGNPSSKHLLGVNSEAVVKDAKKIIADCLKIEEKEIIFTSGATESNNNAILGTVRRNARRGKHIITTALEHPSVREPFLLLEKEGFRVSYLKPDKDGIISSEELKKALDEETIFVSVMYVHNETGAMQDIAKLGKIIKDYNKEICFHVDAVQAVGKLPVLPKKLNVDLLSASAHKFHGPKGVGFLYIKDGVKIEPLLIGGGQQKGKRSGTENVPGIAGMAEALRRIYTDKLDENIERIKNIRRHFINALSDMEGIRIFCPNGEMCAPHIISASFVGVKSEVLLHQLESEGIYVSSGSACSSNKPGLSFSLAAMGALKEELDSVIRFSFSFENTDSEADMVIDSLKRNVPFLRQFVRK